MVFSSFPRFLRWITGVPAVRLQLKCSALVVRFWTCPPGTRKYTNLKRAIMSALVFFFFFLSSMKYRN